MPASSLVLWTGLAHGYTLAATDLAWQADPVDHRFHLDVASFPADVGSDDELLDAFAEGLTTWHDADADLQLAAGGDLVGSTTADGVITARFEDTTADGFRVATATSWTVGGGHSFDCDIVYYGANAVGELAWTLEQGGAGFDLVEVTTHEVGHCLGLDHSDDAHAMMAEDVRDERGLADDDVDGVLALFGAPCDDADGDGVDACRDCDDGDPATHPGAVEACDGVDRDCDGRIDAGAGVDATFGTGSLEQLRTSWGNAARAEADTMLHHAAQWLDLPADARVSWSVLRDDGGRWSRLVTATEIVPSGTGWAESPPLELPLEAGETYAVVVGVLGGATFAYDPSAPVDGPLTAVGAVTTDFVPADDQPVADAAPDPGWQAHQRWRLTDPDGATVCGSGTGSSGTGSTGSTEPEDSEASTGSTGCSCGGAQVVGAPVSGVLGVGWLGWVVGIRRRR